MTSKKYKLNREDGKKIFKGLWIGLAGYVLTAGAQIVTQIDFGEYTTIAVVVSGVIVNAIRKLLKNA